MTTSGHVPACCQHHQEIALSYVVWLFLAKLLLAFVVINLLIGKYSNPIDKLLFAGTFRKGGAAQIQGKEDQKSAYFKRCHVHAW